MGSARASSGTRSTGARVVRMTVVTVTGAQSVVARAISARLALKIDVYAVLVLEILIPGFAAFGKENNGLSVTYYWAENVRSKSSKGLALNGLMNI